MSFGLSGAALAGVAIGGATLVNGYMQGQAAGDAADAQSNASAAGTAEQRRQFDAIQKLFERYIQGGNKAFDQQQTLIGLNGNDQQASAIQAIQNSPQFQALTQQGENAILQNASATGGLRGGNVQAALAQFRPEMLNSLIEQQYSRLNGLSQIGQNSAAGVGAAGLSTGNNIAQLLQQQGAAQANGILAQGKAYGGGISNAISSGFGAFSGLGGKF